MYRFASDRVEEACRVGTKDARPIDVFMLGDSIYPTQVHGRSSMTRTAASIDTDR
jgi:hypothetical protein